MTSLEGWDSAIELHPRRQKSRTTYRAVMEVRTLYELVGGGDFFVALVDRFYEGVAGDEVLRPMYPDDLTASKRHLALFLIQYWGGPAAYGEERGHPRLRMRHAPFEIDSRAREAWLGHMRAALDASGARPAERAELDAYFEMAARQLTNRPDVP
jgi:hemoglobin